MAENLYVVFDLPYPLLILDSTTLDDTNGEAPEIYVAGTPPAGIKTILMSRAGGVFRAWGELEGGDPYGRVSFTRVQVRFHVPTSPEVAQWSDDDLIEHAVERANALVSHYRDLADQPLLAELAVRDLIHFWLIEETQGTDPVKRQIGRARGPLRVGIGDEERARDAQLRGRLQTTEPVPFLRDVDLNTRRHLIGADYALAAIEAALFFEAWLSRLLHQRFLANGLSSEAAKTKFIDERGQPRSIWWVAKNLIPEAYGSDFVSTPEGIAWANDAKDLRNRLVHGEQERASKAEAEAAHQAVANACHVIRSIADAG
ncbi:MAG: hypothetical protein HY525_09785 [Betaproteobacteria bacterium]|nr:hypothetical protein [Betaproteobacteria bacterium]